MRHPKGTRARVLFSSVFKPFAQDDEYGSRVLNPVELYHNQVTRAQGPFSLRMFHRSWGLMFIHQNISAPSTLLDFPTRERFVQELTAHEYDIVGISSIVVNVGKVREMCRLVRLHSPRSTIVVGGHVTSIPGLERTIDADHVVRGEGVAWMRAFLGEDAARPFVHPLIPSSFGFRLMGVPSPRGGGSPSATIVPSVGCPLGCNFCTTSAFFGGKGKFVNFYQRGEDLFHVMCEAERELGVSSFFMMDENFLMYKRRAMELLDCMKAAGKAWALYVFSSANAIRTYDIRELVELGVEWIWLGLESSETGYAKLKGTDTLTLVRELQADGICVHGSTIIGLEHHTPENVGADIDRAVAHETVFQSVHALHADARYPSARADRGGRAAACRRRPGGYTRPVQVQLPTPGNLPGRFEDAPRSRVPPRLRAQRAEPFPADADDDASVAALPVRWRSAGARAGQGGGHPASHRLRRPHSGPWSDICGRGIPW